MPEAKRPVCRSCCCLQVGRTCAISHQLAEDELTVCSESIGRADREPDVGQTCECDVTNGNDKACATAAPAALNKQRETRYARKSGHV